MITDIQQMKIKYVIFDLHGVIIHPQHRSPQKENPAPEVIKILRGMGLHILFATNSSSMSKIKMVEILETCGIETEEKYTVSAGHAMAKYLLGKYDRTPAYFIGKPGFREIIETGAGKAVCFGDPANAVLVIAGGTPDLSKQQLDAAGKAALNGARLLATSKEGMIPAEKGMQIGPGHTIRQLETVMNQDAMVIGKPNAFMLTEVLKLSKEMLHTSLIIGDNEDFDTRLGKTVGAYTVHLSEERPVERAGRAKSDWVIDRLELLPGIINQLNKQPV
jgi:HAD superfamily hydrolase (TIGR01450 family)